MTLKIRPHYLKRDGRNTFAILPIEDFRALLERLKDADDLVLFHEAELDDVNGEPAKPLDQVIEEMGLREEVDAQRADDSTEDQAA